MTSSPRIPVHLWVAASAWAARIVNGLVQIVSIPILLQYLGLNKFAMFTVIVRLSEWFALVDFGMGSSVQNFVSEARTHGQNTGSLLKAATYVVAGLFAVALTLLGIIAVPLQRFVLGNLEGEDVSQPIWQVGMVGLIFVVTYLGGIAYRVLYGQQRGYIVHIIQAIAALVTLALLFAIRGSSAGEHPLMLVLLCWTLPPAVFSAGTFVVVFRDPQRSSYIVDRELVRNVMRRAASFALFAFMSVAVLSVDNLLISQLLTGEDITKYNIMRNIFGLLFFLYSAVLMAIWPDLAECFTKNDWAGADRITNKYWRWGMAAVLAGTVVFMFARNLVVSVLAPSTDIILPKTTIVLFGIYFMIRVWTDTAGLKLLSLNYLRVFWCWVPIQAIISVTGQYFLCMAFGMNGILWGLILSFTATVTWVLPLRYRRLRHAHVTATARSQS
jgi:O-antigen/teichoic acid export membrane protein